MQFAPRSLWPLAALFAPLSALLSPGVAAAADNDAAALALRKDAIYDDYLSTRFVDAETKLLKALSMCDGAADCEVTTRARLHCDLGVIEFALDNPKEGREQFASAAHKDPNIRIDHDLSTPALEKELAAFKAPAAKAAAPATEAASDESAPESAPPKEADCPPGFPGCKEAEAREGSTEEAPPPDEPFKRNWVSLSFQAEALL